jgi:hypothetical protein
MVLSEFRLRRNEPAVALTDLLPHEGIVALTAETRARAGALAMVLRGDAGEIPAIDFDTPGSRREEAFQQSALAAWARLRPQELRMRQAIWPGVSIQARMAAGLDALNDAERKAARTLGVPASAIALAARRLWGRGLTAERDRRVDEQIGGDATPRTAQAHRGHVTRALLAELSPLVVTLREPAGPRRPRPRRRRGTS